jgi:hypothetical protein
LDKITRVTTIVCIIHGGHDNIQNTAPKDISAARPKKVIDTTPLLI